MSDEVSSSKKSMIVFSVDQETEATLRDQISASGIVASYRRGGLLKAIDDMSDARSPDILVIDTTDCDDQQLFPAMDNLASVVEPNTTVMVIGSRTDADFYRQITRFVGAAEYIHKPVTREAVARYLLPTLGAETVQRMERGGRLVGISGAKGGVGATAIVVGLARYLSTKSNRHTVVIDGNVQAAAVALNFKVRSNMGLRAMMEQPDRIDALFVDRTAISVNDRLRVLTSDERPEHGMPVGAGAAEKLVNTLRMRFNQILVDMPMGVQPSIALLPFVQHRIVVLEPSAVAVKGARKLLDIAQGLYEPQRPTVVLNRAGMKGGISRDEIEEISKIKIDIEIPDLGPAAVHATNMGADMLAMKPFEEAIAQLAREIGVVQADVPAASRKRFSLFGGLK